VKSGGFLNRRDVLQRAGGLIAAAFTTRAGRAEEPVSPTMTRLSTYMSEAAGRALPAEILDKAKHHILDTFAAMISGSVLLPGQVAIRYARAHSGEKVATVAGCDVVCGAADAALANGMLAHSDETDDYAPFGTHPGAAVVPGALATGEQFGIDGERFIRAVALGYDVASRVAVMLGGQHYNYDYHKSIHSVSGTFGSAAAGGCVAGLNAQQMRWLLDYAAQEASGTAAWQRDSSISRSLSSSPGCQREPASMP
jgi:2-methylcitrate dehydratase PrpD